MKGFQHSRDGFIINYNKHKSISPQRHRGHREKLFIVNYACGVVNKGKLCVLCASVLNWF
jgi:hypothetical protein